MPAQRIRRAQSQVPMDRSSNVLGTMRVQALRCRRSQISPKTTMADPKVGVCRAARNRGQDGALGAVISRVSGGGLRRQWTDARNGGGRGCGTEMAVEVDSGQRSMAKHIATSRRGENKTTGTGNASRPMGPLGTRKHECSADGRSHEQCSGGWGRGRESGQSGQVHVQVSQVSQSLVWLDGGTRAKIMERSAPCSADWR